MADFASALFARLWGDPDVAAVVVADGKKRIYWNRAAQNTEFPYIVLTAISDPRVQHLKGFNAARQTRVQCDCFARTYATARALAEAVIAALAEPDTAGGVRFGRVEFDGPRDLGEDVDGVGFVHRLSLDLLIEHKLA